MATLELQKLTLAFPPAVEAQLVRFLLERRPALPGFTTIAAGGHGADFATASIEEQVRGLVKRRLLLLVLPAESVPGLVTALCQAIPNPHVTWWVEPVLGFGRLA